MTNGTGAGITRRAPGRASAGDRLPSLDGLRGVAAIVVVVHHAVLTWPALFAQYGTPNRGSGTWWLTFTPFHLAWAGREAVVVFFILSGLVLVLPFLGPRKVGTWPGYVVRRLLRLYPPIAVALVLSAVLVAAFPRNPLPGASYWYTWHDVDLTWTGLLHDLIVIDGTSMINSVLWSLRYEVAFSLALPLVVFAVRRIPPRLAITLPMSIVLVALGQVSGSHWAQWLPIFLVGVALAMGREDMRRLAQWIERGAAPRVIWSVLTVAAVALLLAEWIFRGLHVPIATWVVTAPPLISLGGALVCFIVLGCPSASRLFTGRFLQWAGRISFSLYLVHEPVIVSVASLVQPGLAGVLVTLVAGSLVSVALAVLMHRFVETPSQQWSRQLGRAIDGRLRREPLRTDLASAVITAPKHLAAAPHRPRIRPRPAPAAEVNGFVDAR